MQKLVIPINVFILNIVINSYCLMHRSNCAFSMLPIYLKNGIPFSVVTFNTLLRGIFAENKVEDAIELFKKLVREKICEPNKVMNGLSKRGHTDKTLSLLRIGQWEKVKILLSGMVNHNIYPNVRSFSILTDGLCKEGKVEDAEEIMKHEHVTYQVTNHILVDLTSMIQMVGVYRRCRPCCCKFALSFSVTRLALKARKNVEHPLNALRFSVSTICPSNIQETALKCLRGKISSQRISKWK
ncbi:putative pentatricopeptide repeat-containing protein At1g12700, mitochondrial [Solanum dulcamara]|uniref:putative pentatricopeptide repeat-containing protein At1g12700, mitochondrial n=1 Tax=Solanum dulcamara TaxID=45834 RepID=UPI002485BB16|nr:putative pentatricopeptide repeat-containing protein At1g12700, mitochondrial [Solanum dulcamara]